MRANNGAIYTACTKYESLLEDYLDGNLEEADAAVAAEHWNSCDGCRGALEDAAASVRLLRVAGPAADPGPAFSRIVMARIRASESDTRSERSISWQPVVSLAWRFAATAALALCVMVTYNAGWGRHSQPSTAAVRPMQMTDIFAPDPGIPPADGDEVLMLVAEGGHGNK
jgi:anti-sigma factor RsiW